MRRLIIVLMTLSLLTSCSTGKKRSPQRQAGETGTQISPVDANHDIVVDNGDYNAEVSVYHPKTRKSSAGTMKVTIEDGCATRLSSTHSEIICRPTEIDADGHCGITMPDGTVYDVRLNL